MSLPSPHDTTTVCTRRTRRSRVVMELGTPFLSSSRCWRLLSLGNDVQHKVRAAGRQLVADDWAARVERLTPGWVANAPGPGWSPSFGRRLASGACARVFLGECLSGGSRGGKGQSLRVRAPGVVFFCRREQGERV